MEIHNSIRFYEATPLINCIKKNAKRIRSESINGIYCTSELLSYDRYPGMKKVWTTDTSLIIEFDTFVIQIDYYLLSDMEIKVIDRDSLYKGELTQHIFGHHELIDNQQPFEEMKAFSLLNSPISEVIIEQFSHEFVIGAASGRIRKAGGDYYGAIIIMLGDVGIRMCPENSINDGYLDYELFYRCELNALQSSKDTFYTHIKL